MAYTSVKKKKTEKLTQIFKKKSGPNKTSLQADSEAWSGRI